MCTQSKLLTLLLLGVISHITAQFTLAGKLNDKSTGLPLQNKIILLLPKLTETTTDAAGYFRFEPLQAGSYTIVVFDPDYEIYEKDIAVQANINLNIELNPLDENLSEVLLFERKSKIYGLKRMQAVSGTRIYAGKKNEVVAIEQTMGNLATNNPRQVYAEVVGLNIYENSSGGLQLNIGGRGLDPNRTANFNTRQNDYDISADVLGYPESYYTPPTEALQEIQVIRGAASLQYGSQFGGLINFKIQFPDPNKKLSVTNRQTLGAFDLYTNFLNINGTSGKLSYLTYYNYKKGNGFRPNSNFESKNWYAQIGYQILERTKLTAEFTHLHYLAKQAGGLTDVQFYQNPNQSNRTRNWFAVDWNLWALRLSHTFSEKTSLSAQLFGLHASRSAIGFRGSLTDLNANPITVNDKKNSLGQFINPRDLILGNFRNWGAETRLLSKYKIVESAAVFLFGAKWYRANNTAQQGPGSTGLDADFSLQNSVFPDYPNQSRFSFPNTNLAIFSEHIFELSDKISITPGARWELINTKSQGNYTAVVFDNAGNPISRKIQEEDRTFNRQFLLLGMGLSYKPNTKVETYANVSQNYRSVTFSDIRTVSPGFVIDPDISDEKGFTADLGLRGRFGFGLQYDLSAFGLWYQDRIGTITNDRAQRERTNLGDARIYGVETYANWDILKTLYPSAQQYRMYYFLNLALTKSEYNRSLLPIVGNAVAFVPLVNLKTGLGIGYRNVLGSFQFSYISNQYTEATNADSPSPGSREDGIIGKIPSYGVLDFSAAYTYQNFKLEAGINNVLDNRYFTQRATGYPGPGIIPAEPFSWYCSLQFKF